MSTSAKSLSLSEPLLSLPPPPPLPLSASAISSSASAVPMLMGWSSAMGAIGGRSATPGANGDWFAALGGATDRPNLS